MTKAYDRLSWIFMTEVLRKTGFCERFIGVVFGIMSNSWYSILINGQPYEFFKSTRGVKQGDPLSPTLFILAAEAMSRGLSALHLSLYFCGFGLPKWSPKVNYLVYIDDTIIFSSSDATSLQLIMEVLTSYEVASRQLINKAKSAIYMHHSTSLEVLNKVQRVTRIGKQEFSFTYLGCPIFYARRKMDYYQGLVNKVLDKLQSWKGLGSLYFVTPPDFYCDESIHNVYDVIVDGSWDEGRLLDILPQELALHVTENIKRPVLHNEFHRLYWTLDTRGNFTVKTAWDYIRRRRDSSVAYKNIWVRGLPFKIAFFMWKVWKGKLPFDDYVRILRYFMPSKCINMEGLLMQQTILKCWAAQVVPRLKSILQALPLIIVWELWKRKNSYKYGEAVTVSRVIYQISSTLQDLVRLRKSSLQNVPHKWPDLLHVMEHYMQKLKVTKVLWELPEQYWVKVNTDGTSRGNSRRSYFGFVLRDEYGDILHAHGKEIHEGTNTEAEAVAMLEALKYCVQHGYTHFILQTDSMMLKNVVEGIWVVPWIIATQVEEIKDIMGKYNIRISHIMRESNKLADYLANYALDRGNVTVSMSYYLIQIQWAVLAPSAHSLEGVLVVAISMEARRNSSIQGSTYSHRKMACDIQDPSASILHLNTNNFTMNLQEKDSQYWRLLAFKNGINGCIVEKNPNAFHSLYIPGMDPNKCFDRSMLEST
uniref:Uncharacterized protein n=1 Tax=Nicotiana tabacum TaxID=4097 RepID=A0A1S3ZPD7_TOBAC|nr:PREDICTED: uncharacterized protein LOC107788988 [Nicotiana tabacum]